MITTPHTLVGLAIVRLFPHPISLPLAFLSHFLMDFFFPHWNPHLYTEMKKDGKVSTKSKEIIVIDGLIAVMLTLSVMYRSLPNLNLSLLYGTAAFLAVLPDLIKIPYCFLGFKHKLLKKYIDFEHKYQASASLFCGITTQLLLVLACLKTIFS